ncbi:hypothetical protein F404_gp078 [Vibrio phage pVp-1]|uniref:Uncharacterized protein n=1 Tax=Vibrio phage pVp-1 TaxID=1150989 RepID=H6WXG9_9CAUD|nr:hypothetical protein F404_gp078 [Vibrio phage pVp-1]AFB83935.1 hypothetical protein pVp-1_0078 [Vibrio phage pVp-1]
MRRSVILLGLLISGWANALTLAPMYFDELVYQDMYIAKFRLDNTDVDLRYFDVTVHEDSLDGNVVYSNTEVLGGESYKSLRAPIYNLKPDKLQKFYVCVTEKPKEGQKWGVVGRACAKVRLYWPQSQLQQLTQQD